MKTLFRLLMAVAMFAAANPAVSSQEVDHYQEPGVMAGREYLKDHFSERIDPFSGNLSLQYVDLRIPGNAGFDLKVRRSYNANAITNSLSPFGRGWEVHFGRVRHRPDQACSNATEQSMILDLPDGSSHTLHRSNGVASTSTSDYLTTSFWRGQCASGGMMLASPDGTQYDMSEADVGFWHAKKITDRHGNYFNLSYVVNPVTGRKVVSQVTADDGRSLTFAYSGGKLISISGAGRTWSYTVTNAGDGSHQLTRVNPPAGGDWEYAYNGELGTQPGSFALRQVTNPFSGVLTYTYAFEKFRPEINVPQVTVVSRKTAGSDSWTFLLAILLRRGRV